MPRYEVRESPPSYKKPDQPQIRRPEDAFELCRPMAGHKQGVFRALLLTARHRVFRMITVSKGTLASSLVHPRDVFRAAIRLNADAIIVAHNHPSGDPAPPADDEELTVRLYKAGQILGVEILDHIIVAKHGFVSLREHGTFESSHGTFESSRLEA